MIGISQNSQKIFIRIIVLLFLGSCGQLVPDKKNGDGGLDGEKRILDINLEVKKVTLENGLRVLFFENHQLPIFSYYTFYDVGGRYESKGTTGATHFLEHLMFKGAKKYGPGEFDTIIEKNGGATNAYTTFDSTVYYESLPISNLEKIIDMEADRMVNLSLAPDTFESERMVVLEERKLRYENSPHGKLFLKMMKETFKNTPYGGSVIGEVSDIKNIKRDEVYGFFKRFYSPNNAIIVIAGDIDPKKTMEWINKYFGPIAKSEKINEHKLEFDKKERYQSKLKNIREIKLHGSSPSPMFNIAFKGGPLGEDRSFTLDILSSILGDGESGYFNQEYVLGDKPTLSRIGVSNYTLKNDGIFYISGQLLSGVSLDKVKKDFKKDFKNVCDIAINERSLQKTKNQYLVSYYKEIETNSGIAHFLGLRENFYGDYGFYKKEIDIYQKISVADVKNECNKIFEDPKYIFVSIWDKYPKGK